MQLPGRTTLALSGGNALGAYQGGAYQALAELDRHPDWVAGTSVGALNAAVIAGCAPDERTERLRVLWRLAEQWPKRDPARARAVQGSGARTPRTFAALAAMMTGRPGLFTPKLLTEWMSGNASRPSLFETDSMLATLTKSVDFERLNQGEPRLTVNAVDVQTGEDVVFDTANLRVEADHIRASAAFPGLYPPVQIGGRTLVDGGVSANLPLAWILGFPQDVDTLCIALDLVAPTGTPPATLGDAVKRAQDLVLASQSRHAIQALQVAEALRGTQASGEPAGGAVTLLHICYTESGQESAAKMLDFSAGSIQERWAAGLQDTRAALSRLAEAEGATGTFQAFRYAGGDFTRYELPGTVGARQDAGATRP